jgi:hypothetical protein
MMGEPTPEDSDQPPGARNLVRIFLDALREHLKALEAGSDLVPELTARQWVGDASNAYAGVGLPKLDTEWRKITETHRLATDRMTGYHTFLQNLPALWSAYADDPVERSRLGALYQGATDEVAADLLGWAAQLDAAGHVEFADPATITSPDLGLEEPPLIQAAPHASDPGPVHSWSDDINQDRVHQHQDEQPASTAQPGLRGATAAFGRSYQSAYQLREQIVVGQRRERIPWTV